jgi:hypothetical protein
MLAAAAGCSSSTAPVLAAFDRPASGEDVIPDGVQPPTEYEEIRYVGEAEGALVYAAQGRTNRPWCVLVVLQQEGDWVAGSSCTDNAQFAERGVWASVSGLGGQRATALLLPDDFATDDDAIRGDWRIVQPDLAVPV